ncbi:uncharacterized protein MYCFIDRAFT_175342 [Pseudocercospora fijiensis CIRAD86]|uniref:Uncharacterized protein n=1 Tax=Pseudocercospora fijiensis (strain CIRAD86) TaxID=383855 RepID=M2YVQ6_PSEFD|nr:uncharacterized protein MYCFIDRAFT_175342 [Pseudocercospora fijiensis CIRAD86]EME81765.1 hypothetical protein MYCFIDRAFT_175342 [Pseudocercospora fijiensis CIRAD86]
MVISGGCLRLLIVFYCKANRAFLLPSLSLPSSPLIHPPTFEQDLDDHCM